MLKYVCTPSLAQVTLHPRRTITYVHALDWYMKVKYFTDQALWPSIGALIKYPAEPTER